MVRRLALGTAFALLVAGAPRGLRAETDQMGAGAGPSIAVALEDATMEATTPADAAGDSGDDAPAPRPHARHRKGKSRHHGRFIGRVVPENKLRTDPLPKPSGNLKIVSANNPSDVANVNIYNDDGSYNLDALAQINHVLRCRRTDVEKPIDIQLLGLLSHVYDHFGGKPLEIVSGFRNQRKQSSNHFKGRASDIRIAGISPKKIEAFAETLDRGGMGIGIYPRSHFVHIDVRSPPSYRWTDYSPPNPNAPEKRPPRGWKRKKLES
ncbi:MAG TPA: DUF882 domain-containing protein [Polyangia bacterium]|nr:DUF882 domain-containing protein [Polyangia bacterium]